MYKVTRSSEGTTRAMAATYMANNLITKDVGGNHLLVIGQFTKAAVNPDYYNEEISPKGKPKPFMQWERNNFAVASDIFSIAYFKTPTI